MRENALGSTKAEGLISPRRSFPQAPRSVWRHDKKLSAVGALYYFEAAASRKGSGAVDMLMREFCGLFAPSARGATGQRLVPSGRRTGLLFALAVWIASVAPILAQTFPALTDRVVDEAGIIDPARRLSIIGKLADLEAKTTVQLVVVTLKSLQGVSIEDFALRLGNHWNIGQAGKNNGVLLVVAPKEGKVRIEVGRGLENKLSNEMAKRIIDNSIIPSFRINDLPVGISQGVDDLLAVLL